MIMLIPKKILICKIEISIALTLEMFIKIYKAMDETVIG